MSGLIESEVEKLKRMRGESATSDTTRARPAEMAGVGKRFGAMLNKAKRDLEKQKEKEREKQQQRPSDSAGTVEQSAASVEQSVVAGTSADPAPKGAQPAVASQGASADLRSESLSGVNETSHLDQGLNASSASPLSAASTLDTDMPNSKADDPSASPNKIPSQYLVDDAKNLEHSERKASASEAIEAKKYLGESESPSAANVRPTEEMPSQYLVAKTEQNSPQPSVSASMPSRKNAESIPSRQGKSSESVDSQQPISRAIPSQYLVNKSARNPKNSDLMPSRESDLSQISAEETRHSNKEMPSPTTSTRHSGHGEESSVESDKYLVNTESMPSRSKASNGNLSDSDAPQPIPSQYLVNAESIPSRDGMSTPTSSHQSTPTKITSECLVNTESMPSQGIEVESSREKLSLSDSMPSEIPSRSLATDNANGEAASKLKPTNDAFEERKTEVAAGHAPSEMPSHYLVDKVAQSSESLSPNSVTAQGGVQEAASKASSKPSKSNAPATKLEASKTSTESTAAFASETTPVQSSEGMPSEYLVTPKPTAKGSSYVSKEALEFTEHLKKLAEASTPTAQPETKPSAAQLPDQLSSQASSDENIVGHLKEFFGGSTSNSKSDPSKLTAQSSQAASAKRSGTAKKLSANDSQTAALAAAQPVPRKASTNAEPIPSQYLGNAQSKPSKSLANTESTPSQSLGQYPVNAESDQRPVLGLTGHFRNFIKYIYFRAVADGGTFAKCVKVAEVVDALGLMKGRDPNDPKAYARARKHAQDIMTEVINKKKILVRHDGAAGRHGWSNIEIPMQAYREIRLLEEKGLLTPLMPSQYPVQYLVDSPSSISSLNINTTAEKTVPEEWRVVRVVDLADIDFGWPQVLEIIGDGIHTPADLNRYIEYFCYDLEYNNLEMHKGPLNFFMGIIRKKPYRKPHNFKSRAQMALEERMKAQAAKLEALRTAEQPIIDLEFTMWRTKQTRESLLERNPNLRMLPVRSQPYEDEIKNDFINNEWPTLRANYPELMEMLR